MATFVITKTPKEEFHFALKAGNGETILTSEMYTAKASCLGGIESVRVNAVIDERYELKTSSNNKLYFVLKAANAQVIGTSQMYEDASGRSTGIASVKKNAPHAEIEE